MYSYADLIEFENKQAFSSIGKMPISTKQTLPSYSFGSAERANQAKLYHNKELARIDFTGMNYIKLFKESQVLVLFIMLEAEINFTIQKMQI